VELRLILPLLIPLTAAVASILTRRSRAAQRVLAVAGTTALLAAGLLLLAAVRSDGILASQMGSWRAPFGITLVADLLAAVMVVITGIVGMAAVIFSLGSIDRERESAGYYPLVHALLFGVCGAFLTGDLFNLYVWFEVMLLASFVLLALGGGRAALEGSVKYVVLSLLSSTLFLTAAGLIYGVVGTLNMADVAVHLGEAASPGLQAALGMLLLVAFGLKAAIFPLFFWLPASYHTAPPAVSALFAGLLSKVGVFALIRTFTLIIPLTDTTRSVLLLIAVLTMVTGVLGAAAQGEFRRILGFHCSRRWRWPARSSTWCTTAS